MYQLITTEAVPPEQRRDYWQAAIQPLFYRRDCSPLPQVEAEGGFRASVRFAHIGGLGFLSLDSGAHVVQRTQRHIQADEAPGFLMAFVSEGSGSLVQDGRESVQRAGDYVLYESQRPFRISHDGRVKKYLLNIPRSMLAAHVDRPERLCGVTVGARSNVRLVLKGLLDSVASFDLPLSEPEQLALARSVIQLVVGGLQAASASPVADPNKLKAYHLARIKRYVRDHLADPDLTCESVARALRMSVSSLYRVFEGEPVPVSKWIWQLRVEACARDLQDPSLRSLSISEIAFSRGFGSCAHFSRTFKAHMRVTPSEHRGNSRLECARLRAQ